MLVMTNGIFSYSSGNNLHHWIKQKRKIKKGLVSPKSINKKMD